MNRLESISDKFIKKLLKMPKVKKFKYYHILLNYFVSKLNNDDIMINNFINDYIKGNEIMIKYYNYFNDLSEKYDEEYFKSKANDEPVKKWELLFLKARLYASMVFVIKKQIDEAIYELTTVFENIDNFNEYMKGVKI